MQVDHAFPNVFLNLCTQVRFSLRRKLQKRAQLHVCDCPPLPNANPALLLSYNHAAIHTTESFNPASFCLAVGNASMEVAAASATTLLRQRRY
jgi:hypothetical protein